MSNGDGEKRRGRGDALLPLEADLEVVVFDDEAVQIFENRIRFVLIELEDTTGESTFSPQVSAAIRQVMT